MLKRTSMKQLFVAAYFLVLLLPGKCFPHDTAKGKAYLDNPFTTEDLSSIFLGDVEIEFSWGADQSLTFFQVTMIEPEFNMPFILVQNSPALLQALNQALHFGAAGTDILDKPLPDFRTPLLFDSSPRFQALSHRRMGGVTSTQYSPVAGCFAVRTYLAGKDKLLGLLSATGEKMGPLANLIAINYGGLYIRITSEAIDQLENYYDLKKKEFDKNWRPDPGGSGGATMVNIIHECRSFLPGYFFKGLKYLPLIQLVLLKKVGL